MKKALSVVSFCVFCLSLAEGQPRRAASATAGAGQEASGWQSNTAATSPIEVTEWTAPEPGWLYVLDPEPAPRSLSGRIWLVNPETGKVMGSIRTGSDPDFALSPDGSRLYVTARAPEQVSSLAMIDTARGEVVERLAMSGRMVANGLPPYSSLSVSGDGLALRILVSSPDWPQTDGFRLATFDPQAGAFLPAQVHLGNCGYGRFIDHPAANQFDFLCPTTNRIRRYRLDANSRELDDSFVVLPWVRRLGVAQAFVASGDRGMTIIRGDGAVVSMDVNTATFSDPAVKGDVQGRILPAAWPVSPDGKRLYLGYSRYPNPRFYLDFDRSATQSPRNQTVDEIRVFDTGTWRRVGRVRARAPFWSATVSKDGKTLYAVSPESHSVLVIDAATLRQTGSIAVGGTPALALVAP